MTKPDDIPQDVWDAAASAYLGAWNAHDEMFNPASNSISDGLTLRFLEASARAIMAEREACADYHGDKAAEHEASRHESFIKHSNGMLTDFHEMMARIHRRSAAAIRNRSDG